MSRFCDNYFNDNDYFLYGSKTPALTPKVLDPSFDVRTQTRAYTYIPIL